MNKYSQYTYDNSLLLKAAALVAASANGSLIVDLGSGLVDAKAVLDVTAIEVASNDESYEIIVQGSSDSDFGTAGNIVPLCSLTLGAAGSVRGGAGVTGIGTSDTAGRYVLPFRNERNGTTYRYVRVRTVVVGNIATGINYLGFIAKK